MKHHPLQHALPRASLVIPPTGFVAGFGILLLGAITGLIFSTLVAVLFLM